MIIVMEGWLCRYKILPNGARQIIGFLTPGEMGDMHLGLLHEADHGIQAVSPATIATVSLDDMMNFMERYPRVTRAIKAFQLVDQASVRDSIMNIGRRSSVERIAHLACELYVKVYREKVTERIFPVPLSQIVLADAVGLSAIHVNRSLRFLREEAVMSLQSGEIVILNALKLVHIAGFKYRYLSMNVQ